MLLKKIAQKAAQFAYDHSAFIKKCVDDHNGIQAALARKEDFEIDEVQITIWALDEAAKAQTRVHDFNVFVGTYTKLRQQIPKTQETTNKVFLEKVGVLGRISVVKNAVKKIADASAEQFVGAIMAQTMWTEKGDAEDCVIIYPEQIRMMWWQIAKRGESLEQITRQLVRHEFRHAEQVQALRKEGGAELVKKVGELEMHTSYYQRVMEMDAWNEQHLESYRPIAEFVAEAKAAVNFDR